MPKTPRIRAAIGTFESVEGLGGAVDELRKSGFKLADLSVVADQDVFKAGQASLSDDRGSAKISHPFDQFIELGVTTQKQPVVISSGRLAELLVPRQTKKAPIVRNNLAKWLLNSHAAFLEEQLGRGSLLLWVLLHESDQDERACTVLLRHVDQPVHVHELSYPKIPLRE